MTMKEAIDEVLITIQQPELTVSVSRPSVKLYMNEALQYVRNIAKASDYLFYTKSHSFSGTTVNYPSPVTNQLAALEAMLFIYVPLATDGNARLASNREFVTVGNNSYDTGTTANPVARLNPTNFTLSPTSAGTYYYLATFGEVGIADETVELTTLIPWVFEELVILRTIELCKLRHAINGPQKFKEGEADLDTARKAYLALYRKWMPGVAFREEQPSPAVNVSISSQTQGEQTQ